MAAYLLPYFKVFPAETLADERFQGWDAAARGTWFSLLLHIWVNGSIPAQPGEIARVLHVSSRSFRAVWEQISDRFIAHPDLEGRLTSRRLEIEREEAVAKATAGKAAATSRWDRKSRHAPALRSYVRVQCDLPGAANAPSPAQPSPEEACAEVNSAPPPAEQSPKAGGGETTAPKPPASPPPPPDLSPVVAVLPCVGKGSHEYGVTAAQVAEWSEPYPGLDVLGEVRKARAWLIANRSRRKTHDGIPRFLLNWLNKAQNSNPRRAEVRNGRDNSEMLAAMAEAERDLRSPKPDTGGGRDDGGARLALPLDPPADDVAPDAEALPSSLGTLLGHRWTAGQLQDAAHVEPSDGYGVAEAAGAFRLSGADAGRNRAPGRRSV